MCCRALVVVAEYGAQPGEFGRIAGRGAGAVRFDQTRRWPAR